jgi:hypothetical protein
MLSLKTQSWKVTTCFNSSSSSYSSKVWFPVNDLIVGEMSIDDSSPSHWIRIGALLLLPYNYFQK